MLLVFRDFGYERCAAVPSGTDIPGFGPGAFPQHTADNDDPNLRTLDGYNAFDDMELIAVTTPETDIAKIIPRVKVIAEDITAVGKMSIAFFKAKTRCITIFQIQ